MFFHFNTQGTSIDIPNFLPKWITWCMNTLRIRHCSYWSLEPVLSGVVHRELLSTIFVFSVDDPFPDLPNFPPNGQLGLGMRYGEEMWFILKLRTCTIRCATYGTSINDFRFFGERSFSWSLKISPKWISLSRNTLRRWEKDNVEAKNMYFHLTYIVNLN